MGGSAAAAAVVLTAAAVAVVAAAEVVDDPDDGDPDDAEPDDVDDELEAAAMASGTLACVPDVLDVLAAKEIPPTAEPGTLTVLPVP